MTNYRKVNVDEFCGGSLLKKDIKPLSEQDKKAVEKLLKDGYTPSFGADSRGRGLSDLIREKTNER